MTFNTSGSGSGALSLFNDLKISVAFNHFQGDALIPTLFPSVTTDADGNYEAVLYTPSNTSGSGSSIIKSISVESATISYLGYFLLAAVVGLLVWFSTR